MKFSKRTSYIDISGIRKMFELSSSENVINLGLGEPDFPIPAESKRAIIEGLESDLTHYTPGKGIPELREAIAEKLRKRGIHRDSKDMIVTSGASEALEIALLAMVDEGDEVLLPDPGFVSYAPLTRIAGGTPVAYRISEEDSFEPQPSEIRDKLTSRTKVLIINSPGNPTGAVSQRSDIEEIARIAEENDIFILSDEVYEEIIYRGEHHSPCQYTDKAITVSGFSKSYSMTGLRLGYVHAKAEIVEEMLKVHQYVQASACSLSQAAAVAALKTGTSFTNRVRKELKARRDLMVDLLNEIRGVECKKPDGAFYVFTSFSKYGSSGALSMNLLKEAEVITTPGTAFGRNGEGYLRLSYGTSEKNIIEGLGRIKRYLHSL